ncbi:MAG: hypothetical protein PHI88_02865 [Candidatus Pacebacteria bacterium]|nr:hypothetical protein [Candidatus Paceibacterota bacterium]
MKINITELKFTIKKAEGEKHPNLLAYVSILLKEESGEYLSFSGFTLWKSNYGGYNLEVPGKRGFKYCLIEKSLLKKIKEEVIKKYEYKDIPVIEDEK